MEEVKEEQRRMLQGNVNRLSVSNDIHELRMMRDSAILRINKLFDVRMAQLREIEKEESGD